MQAALSVEF